MDQENPKPDVPRPIAVPSIQDVVKQHAVTDRPATVGPVPTQPEPVAVPRVDISIFELIRLWLWSRLRNVAVSEYEGKPMDPLPIDALKMTLDWKTAAVAGLLVLVVVILAVVVD